MMFIKIIYFKELGFFVGVTFGLGISVNVALCPTLSTVPNCDMRHISHNLSIMTLESIGSSEKVLFYYSNPIASDKIP